MPQKPCCVVAVTSGKGGTGKSTVSAHLGTALAGRGERVLIIEADPGHRGQDLLLGVSDRAVYGLDDLIEKRCKLEQALIPCRQNGLYLIPAAREAVGEVPFQPFATLLKAARLGFGFVLLDGPAGVGGVFQSISRVSDKALIVTTPDEVSVREAASAARLLRKNGDPMRHLVINKVMLKDKALNPIRDFDRVIDEVASPVIAVLPYHPSVGLRPAGDAAKSEDPLFNVCVSNLAARLLGEHRPLSIM